LHQGLFTQAWGKKTVGNATGSFMSSMRGIPRLTTIIAHTANGVLLAAV